MFESRLTLIHDLMLNGIFISLIKGGFKGSLKANGKGKTKAKLREKNLLDESLRISKYTRIKVHVNLGLANRTLNNWAGENLG